MMFQWILKSWSVVYKGDVIEFNGELKAELK